MIKKGGHQAPIGSPLHTIGTLKSPTDMSKPFVAVRNSCIDTAPGHVHSRELADITKEAIRETGVTPLGFDTVGVDGGVAMGHIEMRYSLPSCETIANAAEAVINTHWLGGVFYVPDYDKTTPSMILAAMRTNTPAVFCSGGPMKAGLSTHGKALTLSSMLEAVGAFKEGSISKEGFLDMEQNVCPTCGSCTGMFTVSSMNCLTEVLGLTLSYNGIAFVVSDQRRKMIRQIILKLVENIENDLKPHDIITREAIDDTFTLNMATGGSTSTVLHTLTITNEAGIGYDLERVNAITKRAPYLLGIAPSSSCSMYDVHEVGGIPAIINELMKKDGTLHSDRITAAGKALHENNEGEGVRNFDVIHPPDAPYDVQGGSSILFGNIVPRGTATKVGGVDPSIKTFTGKTICFNPYDGAVEAIDNRAIHVGHVVATRYEGPKDGPGMPEVLAPASSIAGCGLGKDIASITDGRFSGATRGIAVDHVSPRVVSDGPITLIKDGDRVTIGLTNCMLNVNQSEDVLAHYRGFSTPFKAKVKTDCLARYTALVASVNTGGVI